MHVLTAQILVASLPNPYHLASRDIPMTSMLLLSSSIPRLTDFIYRMAKGNEQILVTGSGQVFALPGISIGIRTGSLSGYCCARTEYACKSNYSVQMQHVKDSAESARSISFGCL